MKLDVKYEWNTFPSSKKFQVFNVLGGCIWKIISLPSFNIDTGYTEYYDLIYDDPVTADIICEVLNEEERRLNGQL